MRKTRMCASHYAMFQRYGEIREWSYKWGDGGYISTHNWLRRQRGSASDHCCADCGKQAEEWSYNGGDPDERTELRPDGSVGRFTRNTDAYSPRCTRCHRIYDENPIAMRGGMP